MCVFAYLHEKIRENFCMSIAFCICRVSFEIPVCSSGSQAASVAKSRGVNLEVPYYININSLK
jgi:hypothetical protein